MILIENTEVSGFAAAVRGMRNPMNSWYKSDSWQSDYTDDGKDGFVIGVNDLSLMKKLVHAGTDHSKFMRMITVTCDITAPMYWWAEHDTYKIGTVRNSCSKMHKLLSKPFEMSDFSFDRLPGYKNEVKQFRPETDEQERWKPVFINPDYMVSDQGRIKHGEKILSGSLHNDGYIFATIKGKQMPLHRLIAVAFLPTKDISLEVNHKDGNKQNNFVSNLEWVSSSENQNHAVKTGLQPTPVKTYKGKFTAEQRTRIKQLRNSGVSGRKLAAEFGVSHTCVNDIINNKHEYADKTNLFEEAAKPLIEVLNEMRSCYLSCDEEKKKKAIWYSILQLLPSSYNQRATWQANYAVLRSIYHARKNHKLDEWKEFCKWAESLPYSELITE